jgi:hypothetical protein
MDWAGSGPDPVFTKLCSKKKKEEKHRKQAQ